MKIILKPAGFVVMLATVGIAAYVAFGRAHSDDYTAVAQASGPLPPVAASARSDRGLLLYRDGLQNGWEDWSWTKKHESAADTLEPGAKSAIRVEADPFQSVYLSHLPMPTKQYDRLLVTLNGGADGGQIVSVGMIKGRDTAHPNTPWVLVPLPALKAKQWTTSVLPLATLKAVDKPDLGGVWVQMSNAGTQGTFYVGTVRLLAPGEAVGKVSAPSARPESAPRRAPAANAPAPKYMSPSI